MIKENLFKKVLVTSLCLAMVTSMAACGTKKTANPEPVTVAESTTASTDSKSDMKSDYVNAPVANKDLVDDDIQSWKALDVTPCLSSSISASDFTQEQLDADAEKAKEMVLKVGSICYSENPLSVDVSDICTNSLSKWLTEDGTVNQVVYNQALKIVFASKEKIEITVGTIFNTGTDSFTNTNESCAIYTVSKLDGSWKISAIADWADKYHDNRTVTDITLQMVRTYEEGFYNTLTDKRVNALKIVPRS